ncbi:MAG: DUF1549 domain-containing protein [Myxococcota bacterium]
MTLLLACAAPPSAGEPGVARMTASEALVRASLDLRGTRPTAAEVARVEADPAALDALVEELLLDPRFEARVRDLWSEVYRTRTPPAYVRASAYGLDDPAAYEEAVGEEPLRVLGYVAANDLPWTELATGDWTMADEVLAAVWPIDRPEGEGWLRSRYTDGRPAAGVLATNAMWWRYGTTDSNANRKRANAATRILLCHDHLSSPIAFSRDVDLLDDAAVADALAGDPACVGCHATLDPLASYFYGFWWFDPASVVEASRYHPDRELVWREVTGQAPAYYGEPGGSLADLGLRIAADARFPSCAVEQAWELLLRREATADDHDALLAHRDAFVEGGLTLRALLRSIVADPRYLAGDTDADGYVSRKLASPELLASQVEALTGYRWTRHGYDRMRTDAVGFRTLAGGLDGIAVTAPATSPTATIVLVQERLAEAAAWHAVYEEPKRLFAGFDFADGDAAAQLAALHLAVLGRRVEPDGEEVAALLELLGELREVEPDPRDAWAGVLSALLRDPDFLLY